MNRKFDPDVRLSLQTMKVLSVFIKLPGKELSGADLQKATGVATGTLYPILLRLERARWLDSRWENVNPRDVGRPRRRLYQTTSWGRKRAEREMNSLTQNDWSPTQSS